jgi:hypothetical protein
VPLSRNLITLTSWNPLGHSRPVMGLLFICIILYYFLPSGDYLWPSSAPGPWLSDKLVTYSVRVCNWNMCFSHAQWLLWQFSHFYGLCTYLI